MGLSALLGLTWLLGIPMMDDAKLTFQYIFAILNSLQGVAIFIFQLGINPEVRGKWADTVSVGADTLSRKWRKNTYDVTPGSSSTQGFSTLKSEESTGADSTSTPCRKTLHFSSDSCLQSENRGDIAIPMKALSSGALHGTGRSHADGPVSVSTCFENKAFDDGAR